MWRICDSHSHILAFSDERGAPVSAQIRAICSGGPKNSYERGAHATALKRALYSVGPTHLSAVTCAPTSARKRALCSSGPTNWRAHKWFKEAIQCTSLLSLCPRPHVPDPTSTSRGRTYCKVTPVILSGGPTILSGGRSHSAWWSLSPCFRVEGLGVAVQGLGLRVYG